MREDPIVLGVSKENLEWRPFLEALEVGQFGPGQTISKERSRMGHRQGPTLIYYIERRWTAPDRVGLGETKQNDEALQ